MNVISVLISSPSFWIFLLVNVLGGAAVAIGLWGEGWTAKRKFPERPGDLIPHISDSIRRKQSKRFFEILLLAGVVFEVVAAVITTVYSSIEVARSNERASKFEFAAKQLEAQMAQTSTNVAKVDPLNQPTSDISVALAISVHRTYSDDLPIRDSLVSRIAGMDLCDASISANAPIPLYAESYKRFNGRFNPGNGGTTMEEYMYFMTFNWLEEDKNAYFSVGGTPFTTSALFNYVKFLKFDADFIPHDAEIVSGTGELVIAGSGGFVRKKFEIAPQKPLMRQPVRANARAKPISGYTIIAKSVD